VLPAAANLTATGRFIYQNMTPNLLWGARWFYEGQKAAEISNGWSGEDGASGKYPTNFSPTGGLPPGSYRLELYLPQMGPDGQQVVDSQGQVHLSLATMGDFVIAGEDTGAVNPTAFKNLRFVRANTPAEIPSGNIAEDYPDGASTLFLLFDWAKIAPGTPWTMRWSVDNDIFYEVSRPWTGAQDGVDYTTRLTAPDTLPDGTYKVDLMINNIVLASADVSIGIGQLQIDQLAKPGGASLRGQIVDAETGIGIPGVTFVLISDQFSVSDFTWSQDQVFALATTDRNGNFEIDRPLEIGALYSAITAAQGYLPVSADGLEVKAEDVSPIEMHIPLIHD